MASLGHVPLLSLKFTISMDDLDPILKLQRYSEDSDEDTPSPVDPDDYPLVFAEQSADEFDLADYVRRFALLVPTLQTAEVRFEGLRSKRKVVELKDGEVQLNVSVIPPESDGDFNMDDVVLYFE